MYIHQYYIVLNAQYLTSSLCNMSYPTLCTEQIVIITLFHVHQHPSEINDAFTSILNFCTSTKSQLNYEYNNIKCYIHINIYNNNYVYIYYCTHSI